MADVTPHAPTPTNGNGSSNGSLGNNHVAEILQEEATVGYRPQMPLESMWSAGTEFPQITLRRDIEYMQMHPIVINALEYYCSGISGVKFWGGPDQSNPDNDKGKPISLDPRVAQFVLAHCERYWNRGLSLVQQGGYPYGWVGGEHIYKERMGMLTWDHLKTFHPNDTHFLTDVRDESPVGIRVKGIKKKPPLDLWFASERIPAKAVWYPHRPRFGQFYGRSQLLGAWRPWRRLAWKDGTEQVVDAAVYRAGYRGPMVYYPPGNTAPTAKTGVPATNLDGGNLSRRDNRDVARQIGEYAKAGATVTIPSNQYTQAEGGGKKWEFVWPEHVMDVRPLIDEARYLEEQIMLGILVPPELVKAGGTGSGYSGRSIPREAFLAGQQKVADALLEIFVEQVVRPLVLWNFGDIPFEVQCKSLLMTQADDRMGEDQQGKPGQQGQANDLNRSQAAKDAWSLRKQNQPNQPQQEPAGAAPALSITNDRVLAIARNVLRRMSA